jgi:hypothetical protein
VGSKLQDFSPSSISGPSSRTGAGDLAKPVVEVEYELLSNRKNQQRKKRNWALFPERETTLVSLRIVLST